MTNPEQQPGEAEVSESAATLEDWGGSPASTSEEDAELEAIRERRKRRGRGGGTKMAGEEVSHLNLTPMMEIMTALLVFLVMSFANDPGNINSSMDLKPPESSATEMMKPATTLTITAQSVMVNDEPVFQIASFEHEAGQQMLIPEIRDALDKEREHLRKLESLGGAKFEGNLLVIAHETTPYALMADVLWSAGQAQFARYELVVMKAGQGSEDAAGGH